LLKSIYFCSVLAGYGFKVNWNASLPVCGGLFTGLSHGSIKSPGNDSNLVENR